MILNLPAGRSHNQQALLEEDLFPNSRKFEICLICSLKSMLNQLSEEPTPREVLLVYARLPNILMGIELIV
jgi:hypothetical protein